MHFTAVARSAVEKNSSADSRRTDRFPAEAASNLFNRVAAQVGQVHASQVGPQDLHPIQVMGLTGQALDLEPVDLGLLPGAITRL